MAGFEGADHINSAGRPLDMVAISGHAAGIDADFARLAAHGLLGVRESIGWRLAEPAGGGRYDFNRTLRIADAARRHGVQVFWTLMHYGVPPDLDLLDDTLPERLADFAAAAARVLAPYSNGAPIYNPINEISFLAWAACETNLIHPHIGDRLDPRYSGMPDGFDVKRRLVRAELAAMEAISAEDPRARFLHVDPVVHVVAPRGATPELVAEANRFRDFQWQAWDMLSGRLEPGLGGHPGALDIVGVNHYSTAQWEFGTGTTLAWPGGDPRRLAFSSLLLETWQRYRRPILVAETGHCDEFRAPWLDEIADEIAIARACGADVVGACLYPIVGRPDWDGGNDWHSCGLWDAAPGYGTTPMAQPDRILDAPMAAALSRCRQRVPGRRATAPTASATAVTP